MKSFVSAVGENPTCFHSESPHSSHNLNFVVEQADMIPTLFYICDRNMKNKLKKEQYSITCELEILSNQPILVWCLRFISLVLLI